MPPTILRGRLRSQTFLYDDVEHPDRCTGAVWSPEWTEDDRALLLGVQEYEKRRCPGCGEPRELAWHEWMDGEYEAEKWVCHACTARAGHQVVFSTVAHAVKPERLAKFPPFEIGATTTPPTEPDEH